MRTDIKRSALKISLWCLVTVAFLALGLIRPATVNAEEEGWPRELQPKQGKVVIYQPQLESFQGDQASSRAAVSVQMKNKKEPVFGVVWFVGRVDTNRDTRMVKFEDIKVDKMKFPNATPEQEQKLAKFLEGQIAQWPRTMSFDRLLALTQALEKQKAAAEGLDNKPPVILFRTQPTQLVLISGKPILRDVENGPIQRVVNTPFVLLFDPAQSKYYLTGDEFWWASSEVLGPWQLEAAPPAAVTEVAKKIAEAEVPTQIQPGKSAAEQAPEIIVATEPTSLIVSDGEPQYAPIANPDLLYMTNTGYDVFLLSGAKEYYVLLSGRWFKGPSLEQGPWTFVPSDKLPATFYKIPAGSDKQHVLAFVSGTPEAEDAVADAQMPQTAAINRSATTTVSYDGAPKFDPIEGTQMQYAVNTEKQVIKVDDRYYAVDNAVWYSSAAPTGPWEVATSVPDQVYTIPPSSPVYNVTYVRIYEATPKVVYMGYTPGYTGTYVAGSTVVYGTGYTYPAYVSPTVYYPASVTYGYAPMYNPYYGAWNFMAGAAFGFAMGAVTSNWWGCGGWSGGYSHVDINRNINNYNINRQNASFNRSNINRNIYDRSSNWNKEVQQSRRNDLRQRQQVRQKGSGERLANRPSQQPARQQARQKATQGAARQGQRQQRPAAQRQAGQRQLANRDANRAASREMKRNNVYAGHDGNVYRKGDSGWQQRNRGNWSKPSTKPQSSFERNRSNLNRDSSARQRGAQRTHNFQQMQRSSAPRQGGSLQRRSGGGARSGGGRRR